MFSTSEVSAEASVPQPVDEAIPSGILVCDQAGVILFAAGHAEEAFGYQSGELAGRSLDSLVPDAWRHECLNGAGDAADRESCPSRRLSGRRKDGSAITVDLALTAGSRGQRLMVASVADLSTKTSLQGWLAEPAREHSTFERLVADLTARFVNLAPGQVHDTIIDSLRQICELMDLDRGIWWRVTPDGTDAEAVHSWTRPGYRVVQSGFALGDATPWMLSEAQQGRVVAFNNLDDIPHVTDRDTQRRFNTQSGVAVPFLVETRLKAIFGVSTVRAPRVWSPEIIDRVRLLCAVFGQALERKDGEERLRAALTEVRQLREQLAAGNVPLEPVTKGMRIPHLVVAESAAARHVLEQIAPVATTNATVLLLGETGSGKDVFAHAIHRASERHRRPMVIINCAAIPSGLIESELFGRERGAYTGALARQIGRFELAQGSTLFLDEIGDLPMETQVKLLRVLQDKQFERLGSTQSIEVDVRIIAATNRDLEKAVDERTFREDLYYRLNVFPITIPPLRDRVEDIPGLIWSFIEEFSNAFGKRIDSIVKESLVAMQRYPWPGNVRELRNVIERAVIVSTGPRLVVEPPKTVASTRRHSTRLADHETEHIRSVLESVGWRVRGAGGAADLLGIKPNTLDSRMAKLGIRRPGSG